MTTIHKSHTNTPQDDASCGEEIINPAEVARSAGLRYVSDTAPGIKRKRVGKNFSYIGLDGKPIHDQEALQRIRSLGIPPAWTDVWICPSPNGHIQATGRDAKGRKQYRYHPRWREVRDETKYNHMIAFGEALPTIRARVNHDLKLHGLPRVKVLAAVVWLLDTTAIRVGNEEYAKENGSFGLTTLRNQHVDISGSKIYFHFRGKGGKEHTVSVQNRQLAGIVKRCQDLPGHELFEYVDDNGQLSTVESADVNEYLRQVSGSGFTAKDFRTWAGTVFAMDALKGLGEAENQTKAKKNIGQAIEIAAEHLGNTKTICRKCYVHPAVIDSYLEGSLLTSLSLQHVEPAADTTGLRPEEAHVLQFLKQQQAEMLPL